MTRRGPPAFARRQKFSRAWQTIADEAVASARELFALVSADRVRVLQHDTTSVAAARLFELLRRLPLVSVASAIKLLETSKPTAARAIDTLTKAGVLFETTGKKRDRHYAYQEYLERLRAGTDLDDRRVRADVRKSIS